MGLEATLYALLSRKYPDASSEQVLVAVTHALEGARLIDLDRTDPIVLVTAEHELRLALGLEVDVARLDPERHQRPGPRGYEASSSGYNENET